MNRHARYLTAGLLCATYLLLAPLCIATPHQAHHHEPASASTALTYHMAMYQSFAWALLVSAAALALVIATIAYAHLAETSLLLSATPRIYARCRDPDTAHRMRFARWSSRLLHSPPAA